MSSRAKKPLQFPEGTPTVRELLEAGWIVVNGNTLDARLALRGLQPARTAMPNDVAPYETWAPAKSNLKAIRAFEPLELGRGERRWHLSISHPTRLPLWDEIRAVRDALLPADVVLCIPHPPRAWWLSLHPFCLHLWQVNDPQLEAQWRMDGERAQQMGYGVPTPTTR
ncbi:MAG TPA: hypothetical protein VD838_05850 [Anaeromyxobacteraceae bacterium]|nr:hypothetical protein [Anaeromyxobacteraceae bacterium]